MGRWTPKCFDGNPELHPELHLGDGGIFGIFDLGGGRGGAMDSSSRNRPYESCAAPGPSVNRGRKRGSPCAGEPDSWEQSELPSHGQLCTPTRDQPRQCGTPQLAGSREVHDKHRRGRQLLKAAFMLPRVVSRFRARQLLYRRRRLIPRSRIRMRELSRLRLRPRHLRRRQRCRHCRTLG